MQAHELDPRDIPATGPKQNILKGDVLRYLCQRPTTGSTVAARSSSANNGPRGSSFMLVLTATNLQAIDEFVQETRGTMMRTHLLVTAICQAVARTHSPAAIVALHEFALPVRIGPVGSPLSQLAKQDEASSDGDVYLRINLDCTRPVPPAPLQITVHTGANGHITLDLATGVSASRPVAAALDQAVFMRNLYDNLSDPFLMLL